VISTANVAAWLGSSTPLDDFLAGDDPGRLAGDLRTVGYGIELGAVLVAFGVIALLIWVYRGPASEIRVLQTLTSAMGAVLAVGATLELVGIARQFQVGFIDALELDAGSAAMVRLIAGVMLMLGLGEYSVVDGPTLDVGNPPEIRRWAPAASLFGVIGALMGAASFAFDGHTLTQGNRFVHALANLVHVVAAGVWVGGIVGLVVLGARRRGTQPVTHSIARFSQVATVALVAVVVAGVTMAILILDTPGDVFDSPWGTRLILKVAAVAAAAVVGAYNHFVLVPALRSDPDDADVNRRITLTLQIEAIVLALVVVATVMLVNASPVAGGG